MVSIQLDKEHGYVMLVVAGSFILNMWQMINVSKQYCVCSLGSSSYNVGWKSKKEVQCAVSQDVWRR